MWIGKHLAATAANIRRMIGTLAFSCIFVGAISLPAAAQVAVGPERTQLEAQKAQLFQQMLRDPANLDVTFEYAKVSAQLGDNEAAVAALERMLLFNPNLPAIDLELGALYFRMGAFLTARNYLEKALAANPPPEVKARVEQYLGEIAAQLQPYRLTGVAFAGVQYQSDANVAPGTGFISSPIGPVLLNNNFVKQSDVNFFGTASALFSYDLGTQNRDTIEVGGTGFVNHYLQFSRLDLDLAEVTAGPRFNFPAPTGWIKTASVKPYFIVNDVALGEAQYFYTVGGGFETTALLANDWFVRAGFEYRNKSFSNASTRPLSTGLNGSDKLVSLILKRPVTANSEFGFEFDYLNQSTAFPFYANEAYALSGNYRIHYDDPTGTLPYPWETAFYLGHVWDDYDAPDPCCNTSSTPGVVTLSIRHDRRWQFGVAQSFQIAPNILIVLQLQRDIVQSNLPLYAYTSNSVLVGPQIRF